jgi:hypothetical protein
MEKKRSLKSIAVFNFIPVIVVHICFLPFWFSKNLLFTTNVTAIEMLFNVILLPLYLTIFNFIYSIKKKEYNFLPNIVLMLFAATLGNCLYYFNWGISTGRLFSPDAETVMLFQLETKINFISLLILGIIWQIILQVIKHRSPKHIG